MKKIALFLLILLATNFTFMQQVDAHFLATDGNIGVVLHVDPNDDPIAGSPASFFFEFKDKENKFTPQKCDCTFSIDENGKNIFSQPLFQNNSNPSLNNASVFYTFSQRDVYQIKVIGKPTLQNAFQPFTLSWNFRVDQEALPQTTGKTTRNDFFATHTIHIIIFVIVLIGFLAYIRSNSLKKKQTTKGGEKKNDKKDICNMF